MFIIAEQCGLMVPMGASILRMAVKQARRWAGCGHALARGGQCLAGAV
jgi:EAL domain-containing protein (putative c-di-GMP-specific phosphodiesterase class I)